MSSKPAIWFPTVRTGTGSDVFTERLVKDLQNQGFRAEITWLPLRAEYAPWSVRSPCPPSWSNICHVNTWLHSSLIPKNMPVLATLHHSIHDPSLRKYKGGLRAAYHRYWIAPNERRIMHRANQVIAVSEFVAKIAKQTLCEVPISIIYNGIDIEKFYPEKLRARENEKPFHLLYIGSWSSRKGVDMLAPIMSELGNEFELYYTGGCSSKKDSGAQPKNMHNINKLPNDFLVAESMRRADALIFPSRSEGFGLVAAEAMACGIPVIATRGSSITEVVSDGVTGLLCQKDAITEFAAAARRLRNENNLSNKMSVAARERAIQLFSKDEMIKKYLIRYAHCLN